LLQLLRSETIENPWSSVEQAHEVLKEQIGDDNIKSASKFSVVFAFILEFVMTAAF